jgi:hypothetical protein
MTQDEIESIKHGDLWCSHGPVSSLPGSSHPFPEGSMCDSHPTVPAVARIQGETDSMGCEYVLICAECQEALRLTCEADYEAESKCDWCGHMKVHCRPHRDMDEGMSGPLYNVCGECRTRESEEAARELEERGINFFDDHD